MTATWWWIIKSSSIPFQLMKMMETPWWYRECISKHTSLTRDFRVFGLFEFMSKLHGANASSILFIDLQWVHSSRICFCFLIWFVRSRPAHPKKKKKMWILFYLWKIWIDFSLITLWSMKWRIFIGLKGFLQFVVCWIVSVGATLHHLIK